MSRPKKILEMVLQYSPILFDSTGPSNIEYITVREENEGTLLNLDSDKKNIALSFQDIGKEFCKG